MSSTIKSVKLLYPSLMKEDAAQRIMDLHKQVAEKEEERCQCFRRQLELDREIEAIKHDLTNLNNTYELVYEQDEVKEIVKGDAPTIVESNGTIHI